MNAESTTKPQGLALRPSLIAAIAGREIKAFLSSPLGYVFVALFVGVSIVAFFLVEKFFAGNQASARGFFRWMPALLVLVCPALTMRLWADERRLGTFEILATLPLHPAELVLGKFLAAKLLLVGALLFTFGIPATAAAFGDLDWGPVFAGYIGAILMGSAYLAIGLVCSALVQDQMLALFLGWVLSALTLLPDASFWATFMPDGMARAFQGFGFASRFEAVERGLLDFGDLVFYLSVTGFFLFVNTCLIHWRRYRA